MYKVTATQISDYINIDSFQAAYTAELLFSNYSELFYEVGTEQYVSVLKYGVVCFLNLDDTGISEFTEVISQHCKYFYDVPGK